MNNAEAPQRIAKGQIITNDHLKQPPPLTVDQALHQAIAHHRAGQLQDAERLYHTIFQAQPDHSDANHNLGVLAVQMKQPAAGLPYFKAALEANPNYGQYWLSYIDALIQAGQAGTARQVLEQGRQRGLREEEAVEVLAGRIEESEGSKPDPRELDTLAVLFNEGRYTEAATLAQTMTTRFPLHGFGWKVLGAVLQQMGRDADALTAMQKAAELSPGDAEAHSNLGAYLSDLGRLAEAEASCRKALQIKPDYADAHFNLGVTLQNLGRLDEAEVNYQRALQIKPDIAQVHYNLANAFKDMGRLDEAEASYRRALEIMPELAGAHNNLGNIFKDMGRLDEAEASYRRALQVKPDFADALLNLGHLLCNLDDLSQAAAVYQKTLDIDPGNYGLDAAVYLAVLYYLHGKLEQCRNKLLASRTIMAKAGSRHKNSRIYWRYLDKLLSWQQQVRQNDHQTQGMGALHVIGESHSLSAHGVVVRYNGQKMRCAAEWISGCKQWHLGNGKANKFKHKFEAVMARLPRDSAILLFIGEIDCRHDEGIIKAGKKYPEKTLTEVVQLTVVAYLNYIAAIGGRYGHRIIVGGVPAPNISSGDLTAAEIEQLVYLIRIFNTTLKSQALAAGMDFLDVYALTDRGDGIAGGEWHIDNKHLLPSAVVEAFGSYCLQEIALPVSSAAPQTGKIVH